MQTSHILIDEYTIRIRIEFLYEKQWIELFYALHSINII